jgi:hypothetical protein
VSNSDPGIAALGTGVCLACGRKNVPSVNSADVSGQPMAPKRCCVVGCEGEISTWRRLWTLDYDDTKAVSNLPFCSYHYLGAEDAEPPTGNAHIDGQADG